MMSISAVGERLGMYKKIKKGNEAEWVQCGCSQWIHEDCIDGSTVVGSNSLSDFQHVNLCLNLVLTL